MSNGAVKHKFWNRKSIPAKYDIAILRPSSLPKGKRFETIKDSNDESLRSENLLPFTKLHRSALREYLHECRDGDYDCFQTFCPRCARTFRRWFIAEVLQTTEGGARVDMMTVLLEEAPRDKINILDPAKYRALLRKRLNQAGLGGVPVIGGFEMIYRARSKQWVLHINLVIVSGDEAALGKFQRSFDESSIERPVVGVAVKDRAEQLSYVLKFTTYHRPHKQTGASKSQAMSLNAPEHLALVKWMARYEFKDLMFLFNARRAGSTLALSDVVTNVRRRHRPLSP